MQALARVGGRLPLLGKAPLARSQTPARPQPPARTVVGARLPVPAAALLPAPSLAPAPLPSVAPSGLTPDWPGDPALPTPRSPASSLNSLPGSGRDPTGGPDSRGRARRGSAGGRAAPPLALPLAARWARAPGAGPLPASAAPRVVPGGSGPSRDRPWIL